ncbi:hypothetical protein D6764_00325 [Candidatus Woesearchaeota archaeon]|nr:MAG: hypothetical protein D6764_00325 [Candidatus Woesearchaeota archaeon]
MQSGQAVAHREQHESLITTSIKNYEKDFWGRMGSRSIRTENKGEVGNVILVGTSHISSQSVEEVSEAIKNNDIDIVALELDAGRFHALMHESDKKSLPSPLKVGFKGFFFSILGSWAERMLGKQVGVSPGSEMIAAAKTAMKTGKAIALVDQNIEVTLKRFSREITWREKWRFIVDMVKSVFGAGRMEIDLRRVPEKKLINKLLKDVKRRYPSIFKVLVTERNEVIAENLARLALTNSEKRIVAVIGAGHLEEVGRLLEKKLAAAETITDVPFELTETDDFEANYSFSFEGIKEEPPKETDLNRKRPKK